ncbi:hypothetical protein ILUMI_03407 [Ignelater luminosus]|uniref:Reverse transcriptase domain-containing protein n=1 Tax=Ignelater luminosus TaxID=2038154 RepID=A0A8K0DEL5_IGNLU|nr:hypothetical protein ILUMI_03407 [Ignelater luminosus]
MEGSTFADVLKKMRKEIDIEDIGVQIQTLKKTTAGNIKITMKEKKEGTKKVIIIRDIDLITTEEELVNDLARELNMETGKGDIKIHTLKMSARGDTQIATVGMNPIQAKEMIRKQRIKIGWVFTVEKGDYWVWVKAENYIICSCYYPPSLEEVDFRTHWMHKSRIIRGDMNAKSPLWDASNEDVRGELISTWIRGNMVVVNRGDTPTFGRYDQKSYIDVTLCTDKIYDNIQEWKVEEEEENLSWHRNIYYYICKEEKEEILLRLQDKLDTLNETPNVDSYTKVPYEACNKHLTPNGVTRIRKPVYWWTEEIGKLRDQCIRARRQHIRMSSNINPQEAERFVMDMGTRYSVTSGIPQSSILGPTLWNLYYDSVIKVEVPEVVYVSGYADDLAMVVVGKSREKIEHKPNRSIVKLIDELSELKLELAHEKTEALMLKDGRKIKSLTIQVGRAQIETRKTLNYLGVWFDKDARIKKHIAKTAEKGERAANALVKLMPRIEGPTSSKKRTITGVVESILLYGAPAWIEALKWRKYRSMYERLERKMALRVAAAYCTASTDGLLVIARMTHICLLADERTKDPKCKHCTPEEVDNAEHIITSVRWRQEIRELKEEIGSDITTANLPNIINNHWKTFIKAIEKIMKKKETEDRENG